MSGELIEIRGKKLYVECIGSIDKPPVLYLHGGPGESCHDFSYHQSKRLGEHVRLIAIDQRGVCRSEIIH
jgi:proline iminopeptidase